MSLTGLMILGLVGIAQAVQAKILYQEDYSNWRDEGTNPGFNAFKEVDKGMMTIKTNTENNFGKIMSAENGISVNIDENTIISFRLLADIPKGDIKVNLMTNSEPYDSHELFKAYKAGEYSAKIAGKTPWSGKHSFWIEIWLEGFERVAKISDLKISDGVKDESSAVKKVVSTAAKKK
jgi:hypothetical protein